MCCIIIRHDLILCILRSDRYKLLSGLSKIIQILDRIRILTADRHADHAGADVILRENVFLFAGRRLPYPLRPDIIFA